MNPDNLTGWDLIVPRHPLHVVTWLLMGVLIGWMIRTWLIRRKTVSALRTVDAPLVRVVQAPYEGMIICRDHLRQIEPGIVAHEELPAAAATFWGHRCAMCGVDAVPGRLCENEDCRRPLHPQWPAVYCCNDCALDDL